MKELRFAILGTGFWARYQLAGWREIQGARCVALYNRTPEKAYALAREFGISAVYDSAEKLLEAEKPDFLDVITDASTHSRFVNLAAAKKIPVICQKPMAPSITEAEQMVKAIRDNGGTVWYLMAKDEGHGFAKKTNYDFQFLATILFLRQFLLN